MVRKGSRRIGGSLKNTEKPAAERASDRSILAAHPTHPLCGGVLGVFFGRSRPVTPRHRLGACPERFPCCGIGAGAKALPARHLSMRASALPRSIAMRPRERRMDASSLPHQPRTSGHTELRQALTDLLELAGSERTGAVLELLRELLLMPAPGGEDPMLLTLEQVAARLQVHPRTIRRAIETGNSRPSICRSAAVCVCAPRCSSSGSPSTRRRSGPASRCPCEHAAPVAWS
jgi:hypothetical protein